MNVDLATVILARLKELASCNGSTIQRVASYFTEGLQCRVEGVKSLYKGQPTDSFHEMFAAFQALQEISPYIKFGHFTANQAILEAVGEDRKVHIIDYDIAEGVQWPSLMQALANRKSGPPHLRITVLCRPDMKRALTTVQTTGKRLAECAASFGIPFVFHQLKIDDEGEFRHSSLKILKGETLVVNCMLHLPHMPHRSPNAVLSFFRAMQRLSPTILALVEEELSCGFPSFDGHFYEAFQHYCAIFDSLEASLSSEIMTRTSVERIFLGPRIKSTLNFSNNHHNPAPPTEDLTGKRWSDLARSAGFKVAPLSTYNYCQAKLLVGLFKEGYQLKEDSNLQRLTLGWISKSLIAASVWYCTN
ncbi:hypothetical protein O6H91_17G029100 [Diphasiastrum complanatum]|nr:hypothetical protein O6H91_17G029100 [Diphasiastrum complanatum]